jgi:hypothetical protein
MPRRRPDPASVRFVPYLDSDERPLCLICGPDTHKRAMFIERREHDRWRERGFCATCAVLRLYEKWLELSAAGRAAQALSQTPWFVDCRAAPGSPPPS